MITEALAIQLAFSDFTLQGNLAGVTHEQSLRSAREGGNSINWVLGHMLSSRGSMLRLLGLEPLLGEDHGKLYGRGTGAIGPDSACVSLERLRELWAQSQTSLTGALGDASAEQLERCVPKLFQPEEDEPVGIQLAQLVFHESYHAGQLGVIRRNLGLSAAIA